MCVCVCVCLFVNVFELVWPCVALCGIVSILADSQDVKYFELRNDFTLPTNNNCMGDGLPCTTFYHETCHNLASEALDADIYVVGIEHVRACVSSGYGCCSGMQLFVSARLPCLETCT